MYMLLTLRHRPPRYNGVLFAAGACSRCVGFLRKVGSGGRFRCPTCRRSSGFSDVRFASTLDQSDGSASG